MTFLSFHGNPKAKTALLNALEKHKKADAFLRGTYYMQRGKNKMRGCAVGCTIYLSAADREYCDVHEEYEVRYGIPRGLARLEDIVFERYSANSEEVKNWPIKFIEAIPVGVDLSRAYDKIVLRLATKYKEVISDLLPPDVYTIFMEVCAGFAAGKYMEDTITRALDIKCEKAFWSEVRYTWQLDYKMRPHQTALAILDAIVCDRKFNMPQHARAKIHADAFFRTLALYKHKETDAPKDIRFGSFLGAAILRAEAPNAVFKRVPPVYRPFDLRTFRTLENQVG